MVVHKSQNDDRLRDLYLANQLLTDDEVIKYAKEAVKSELHSITVNTACVKNLGTILKNSKTKLRVAVGFPYGQQYSEIKYLEAKKAIVDGADEILGILNHSKWLSQNWNYMEQEINGLVDVAHYNKKTLVLGFFPGCFESLEYYQIPKWIEKYGVDGIQLLDRMSPRPKSNTENAHHVFEIMLRELSEETLIYFSEVPKKPQLKNKNQIFSKQLAIN